MIIVPEYIRCDSNFPILRRHGSALYGLFALGDFDYNKATVNVISIWCDAISCRKRNLNEFGESPVHRRNERNISFCDTFGASRQTLRRGSFFHAGATTSKNNPTKIDFNHVIPN